jgi:hypothetical protein
MLYEGVPIKKKPAQEVTPAHPAPVHEKVFGREETIKALDGELDRKKEESMKKSAPEHDRLWGIEDREIVYKEVADRAKAEYRTGMGEFLNTEDRKAYEGTENFVGDRLEKLGTEFRLEEKYLKAAFDHAFEALRMNPRGAEKDPEAIVKEAFRATCSDAVKERRLVLSESVKGVRNLLERLSRSKQLTSEVHRTILEEYADEYEKRYLPLARYIEEGAAPIRSGELTVDLLKDKGALQKHFEFWRDKVSNEEEGRMAA